MGDGLRRALDDIRAARPAGPARVLLLSDGASSTGSHPAEAVGKAATWNIPILAGATGGRAVQARSSAELEAAVELLGEEAGVVRELRELTLPLIRT